MIQIGVNMPLHFMIRPLNGEVEVLVDPFDNGKVGPPPIGSPQTRAPLRAGVAERGNAPAPRSGRNKHAESLVVTDVDIQVVPHSQPL